MTEAEKLLQETKSAVVADAQTEDICIIDSNLRIASIPESFKVLGVEHDKDVRVVQFRMPKLYKNIDLSTFTISVNYQNANGIKDRYLVTDKNVSSDYIEFSWTVGSAATKYKGDTKFIVCMRMIGTEGIIEKEFNTTLATMTVLEGLEVDNPVIEQEEKDIIAQLLQIVDDKCKETVQAVTAEGTKQIKAVQDAAKEAVKNEAEEAVREAVQESIDTITAETEKQKELIVAEGTKRIERVTEEGTKQVEIVQGAAQEIVADREQIQTNKQDIADLQSYIGYYEDEHVVGLQVDYKNKTFKRLAGAVNLTKGADFDRFSMFGGRRRCNVADNGTIVAWYGDPDYKEDGTMGQVMVYQPAFYYRVHPLELDPIETGIGYHLRKANYYVSDIPVSGFRLHPAFYDENGNQVDYILMGAYEGSIFDTSANAYLLQDEQVGDFTASTGDKFSSIAGVKPTSGKTQNLTRPNIEQLAKNRGAGWHLENTKIASMNQLLMIIEIGQMELQSVIGQGATQIHEGNIHTENNSVITGGTSKLGNKTGSADGQNGKVSISYRGFENPWGNIFKFIGGVNIWGNGHMSGGQPYICKDFNYAENKNTDNYVGTGFTVANKGGYISAMGYSPSFDWLFMASECLGNSSLPVGDYTFVTENLNGYRIARLGGEWNGWGNTGAFSWDFSKGVDHRYRASGGRLVYIPTRDSAEYTAAIALWKEQMEKGLK